MDPTACYREMKLAMRNGDFETAREYALNLQRWLNQRDFEPEGENILEVKGDSVIRGNLKAYPYLEARDIDQCQAYAAWRMEARDRPLATV
jgi:hypothetical protein